MRKSILLAAVCAFAAFGVPSAFAQTAPTVAVRAGEHETFDRVVFDWPKSVKFHLTREGGRASITFDAPASIKFPSDIQDLIRAQSFAARTGDGNSVTVSFTVNPDAIVKAFANDSSVVIDVQGKPVAALKTEPVAPAEPAKTMATPAPQPEAASKTADATDKPQTLLPATSQPVPAKPAPTQPAPAKPAAAKPAELVEPSQTVSKNAPAPAVSVPALPSTAAEPTRPQPAPKNAGTALAPASEEAPAAAHSPKSPEFGFSLSDTPVLVATLDPHLPTRAVIFSRADVGYIIFDKKLSLSPAALQNGMPSLIDLQAFDMPTNSGYRFPIPPNASLQATMDKTSWKIFVLKKQQTFSVTTMLVAQPDFALGARLLLPLPDAPDPIRFTDPVVGDDLVLIPLAQSEAFNVERRIPNLAILPAAQGLVIKPLTDKVLVRPVSDGIEITAEGGLSLSRASDTGSAQQSSSKMKAAAAGKSIFDFATWGGKPGETFTQTRQRLQQTIVDVPETERNRARMELARFYFAVGEGEEAVSLLDFLSKQVPDLKFHSDFIALLGASEILAYRTEDGLRDLSLPALADQPEIGLWQAVGLAQMREWQQAEEKFSTKEGILAGYPEPFFSRFFVLAVESALAANQVHEAADWLNFISTSHHSESIKPALAFLRGAIDANAGHAKDAQAAWKEAKNSSDRLYKVRADLALIDLGVSEGSLTPAQAADRLEALRFGWRGDDLEVDILRRLGQFYIQAKNIKAGINVMARVATLYPSSSLTPAIRSEMVGAFRDVFLGPAGEKLSALDALTLYRQYRDMLPAGVERDSIMVRLSERLVAVDLLDQASSLLEDLAKNHLQGPDKDRAVLRLSAIRLLDHKPTEAIAALDILGNASLQPQMQNERVLLHARALSELHRDDEASALLKDNTSTDAALLRADIAMRTQNWGDAAKTLMVLVGAPAPDRPLSQDQAEWLINAAIAYALADDQASLDKLAIDYGKNMETQPQNGTFRMLTRPEKTGQLRDLAAAQVQLSQVDVFQGFLNNYRKAAATDAGKEIQKP
jgi:hypothetical protein